MSTYYSIHLSKSLFLEKDSYFICNKTIQKCGQLILNLLKIGIIYNITFLFYYYYYLKNWKKCTHYFLRKRADASCYSEDLAVICIYILFI